jgi:hypothetical protein
MRVSIEDLEMALNWIKDNSSDPAARMELEMNKCIITVGTPDQELVRLTLFDADSSLNAKIMKEDYLKHNMKRK